MKCSRNTLWLAADVALFLAFMALVTLFLETGIEDARINYRYARNLVRGNGMVYTPGEFVEGTSCIAWTAALAGLYRVGFDLPWAGRFLAMLGAGGFFLVLRHVSKRLFGAGSWRARIPLLGVVCATCVPASFGNLLEGAGVACLIAMLAWGIVERRWAIMALAAASLMPMRPEGPAYAVLAGLWLIFEARAKRVSSRDVWRYMAVTECALLLLILFRFWYFGDILPNPIRAKGPAPEDLDVLGRFDYALAYLLQVGTVAVPLGVLAALCRKTRPVALALLGLAALNVVIAGARGDWMLHYRLLTPYFQLLLLAAALGLSALEPAAALWRGLAAAALLASLVAAIAPGDIAAAWRGFQVERLLPAFVPDPASNIAENRIARSLSNLDLARPDDLAAVELGGGDGFAFDGVPVIEMHGLADRKMCTQWPGCLDFEMGGVYNWKYVLSRNPTYLWFSGGMTWFTRDMLKSAALGAALERYVFCRAHDPGLKETIVRVDRDTFPLFLCDYGDFCPPRDYLHAPESALLPEGDDRTPWQLVPWRSGAAEHENRWREWGEIERVSAQLEIAPGATEYRRTLWDASSVVVVFGVEEDSQLRARVRVFAEGEHDTIPIETVSFAGNETNAFQTCGIAIAREALRGATDLGLEVDAFGAGVLYVAAYRWNGAPPLLPSAFVRAKWEHALRYCAGSGDGPGETLAQGALERFEASPEAGVETRLERMRALNRGAIPLREAVRTHPEEDAVCDALDAYYVRLDAPGQRCEEWQAMTDWFPEQPEPWRRLAQARFDNGEFTAAFQMAAHFLDIVTKQVPYRERLETTLKTFAECLERPNTARRPSQDDLPALRQLFETALPASSTLPAAVATLARSAGFEEEALQMYTRIVAQYTGYADASATVSRLRDALKKAGKPIER